MKKSKRRLKHGIKEIELVVASSIGADLAMAFLRKATRRIMVPFLYIAMKSLYWSKGKMLKRIMWCDDGKIKLQMHLLSEN